MVSDGEIMAKAFDNILAPGKVKEIIVFIILVPSDEQQFMMFSHSEANNWVEGATQ